MSYFLGMHKQAGKIKAAAGTKLPADYKRPLSKREIRFATAEQVRKAGQGVNKEFAGAFKILAK